MSVEPQRVPHAEDSRNLRPRGEKLAKRIARQLLTDVADGRAAFGDSLEAESEMAASMGVGRTSVREALRLLELIGLVTIRQGPGGGPTLCEPQPRDMAEILTMFFQLSGATVGDLVLAVAALQGGAAYIAADRCRRGDVTEEQIAKLRQSAETSLEGYSSAEFLDHGTVFHRAIPLLAGNSVLESLCASGSELLGERVLRAPFALSDRVDPARISDEHLEISDLVISGDAVSAMETMYQHQVDAIQSACAGNEWVLNSVLDWRG